MRERVRRGLRRLGRVPGWLWVRLRPRLPGMLGIAAVAITGAAVGAAIAPGTTAEVGPLQAEIRVVPSLRPGLHLLLPPAGEVDFDTHRTPVAVEGRISRVDLDGARNLIDSPAQLRELSVTAPRIIRAAVVRASLITAGCALGGGIALSLLVYRRTWRRTGQVAGTLVGILVATTSVTLVTADAQRLAQPRFTGLLSQAPYIAGDVPGVLARLESYRSGLADLVRSVTTLYATAGSLPDLAGQDGDHTITVLHVSDVHLNPLAFDLIEKLVTQFRVDVVVDTGDITTWGTEVETGLLSRIRTVKAPYVFVRGNHDSGRTERAIAANPNAVVLGDTVVDVGGLVIAGIGDPAFSPDTTADAQSAATGTASAGAGRTAVLPPSVPVLPTTATGTPANGGASPTSANSSTQTATSGGRGARPPTDPQYISHAQLAERIRLWNEAHPSRPVEIAAVHEPFGLQPLMGTVPLVFAGHLHRRDSWTDHSGTRVYIEGSTGGAGLTSRGLDSLSDGKPLPLAASLLHIARDGPRAGQVLAVDAITVGGFGLTSVSLDRTVVPPAAVPHAGLIAEPATPGRTPTPTPSNS